MKRNSWLILGGLAILGIVAYPYLTKKAEEGALGVTSSALTGFGEAVGGAVQGSVLGASTTGFDAFANALTSGLWGQQQNLVSAIKETGYQGVLAKPSTTPVSTPNFYSGTVYTSQGMPQSFAGTTLPAGTSINPPAQVKAATTSLITGSVPSYTSGSILANAVNSALSNSKVSTSTAAPKVSTPQVIVASQVSVGTIKASGAANLSQYLTQQAAKGVKIKYGS